MRTLEECRSILGLKRREFADRLGIEISTYYNAMKRTPSRTVLILANLLVKQAPISQIVKVVELEVDRTTLSHDMTLVHELRTLTTPKSWKEIAIMANCSPDTIQRRYYRWKAERSLSSRVSPPTTSELSRIATMQTSS